MPDPIKPQPRTPTVLICIARPLKPRRHETRRIANHHPFVLPCLRSSMCCTFRTSCRDVVAGLARAECATDFLRALPFGRRHRLTAVFEGARLVVEAEMLEHQGRRQDRAHRVGDVLSSERRRRAVDRLEHRRPAWMEIARRRQPETALQRGAKVRDDVAEEIVGHDDVELRRDPGPASAPARRCRGDAPRCPDTAATTSLKTRCHSACPSRHRVALVGHAHARRPFARAYSNAWRTIR